MQLKSFCVCIYAVLFVACQKGENKNEQSSLSSSELQTDTMSAAIQLTVPEVNRGPVKLDVKNIDNVKAIELTIDELDVGKITKLPYQVYFDGTQFVKAEVKVKAVAKLMNGATEVLEKVITNIQSTESGSGPTNDPNCFTNETYDACLFYKNPVAQAKMPLAAKVSYGADLQTVQTFGVKFRNLPNPNLLRNTSVDVFSSAGSRAAPVNGKWNFAYRTDTAQHAVAQVMAFYWLNEQIDYMKMNSGIFYAENKNIRVDAFSSAVNNNAYWDGANIVMGNFGAQELALSSEVYLHEMGHANLDFATNRQLVIGSSFCATKFGCIGAIHEGMADIHGAIMFPQDPTMAQTVTNTLAGWTSRDPRNFTERNLDYFFTTLSQGGEIHGMGTAYSTILWQIFKDPAMNPRDFETLFSMHLPRLTSSSDFRSAKSIWINLSETRFAGKYTTLIRNYFEKMGVI